MKIKKSNRKLPEINTTALPDIILMLLFFFMVTTVMQNNKLGNLVLPTVLNVEPSSKADPRQLSISIQNDLNSELIINLNGKSHPFNQLKAVLNKELISLKNQGVFPDKAILYAESKTSMLIINTIKRELQDNKIYNLEYIHKGM